MEHKEALASMLQDIINDRTEQAAVTIHDYFVAKTREVTGMGRQSAVADETPADTGAAE